MAALALGAVAGSALVASPALAQDGEFVPGRLLVKPHGGLPDKAMAKVLSDFGVEEEPAPGLAKLGVHVIRVPEGQEDEFRQRFAGHPFMAFAELDRIAEPADFATEASPSADLASEASPSAAVPIWAPPGSIFPDGPPSAAIPNDAYFSSQWHLPKIQAPLAWDTTLGSSTIWVAVIDSGVDAGHPDLAGKVDTALGRNVALNNNDLSLTSGHGTKVAGVIGAQTNNGPGVAAVGWNTRIMPVRATDTAGSAAWSSLANGIIWAADNGARVANISYDMSWYCGGSTLASAAQYMRSKGGLVVASAGNSGSLVTCAQQDELIIVSATNGSDSRTSWSTYGTFVDVAAPGESIWTTDLGGGYSAVSGTSFSAPVTAGVIALMMAANPSLTPNQLETILESTADKVLAGGSVWPNSQYGHGRVNAANAVVTALTTPAPDGVKPSVSINTPQAGAVVSGTVSVTITATDNVGVVRTELYASTSANPVAVDATAPFDTFVWDTTAVADGPVTLTAKAYDAAGNVGQSSAVGVTVQNQAADTTPPTAQVLAPAANSTVSGTVTISARGTDPEGLQQTEILIDGKQAAVNVTAGTTQDLTFMWNTRKVKAGPHTITARSTNRAGLTSEQTIPVIK